MEEYIQNIELINQFINDLLSENEIEDFENRLKSDSGFKTVYTEHIILLEGIKRSQLKVEIQAARKSYVQTKWLKIVGVSIGVVLVSAILYSLFFRAETPPINQPTNNIEVISDSVVTEKPIKPETEISEQVKEVTESSIETKKEQGNQKETFRVTNEPVVESEAAEIVQDTIEAIKPKPLNSVLTSFYKLVKKRPEIIELNTEKDATITCKEGTKLTIPAKSFIDVKTGKLARGKINLEVTEFYKLSDMLLANLTTKSDDKVLETGGMLYVNANKKGSKLKLKEGKHIQVVFNNKGKKDMQLFYGEELNEGVNWKVQTNNVDSLIQNELEVLESPEEDIEVPFSVVEEPPIYPGCVNGSNQQKKACMSKKISKFVQKEFNTDLARGLGLIGRQRINVIFKIDKDGSIINIQSRALHPVLQFEAERVISALPKMKPGKQRGKTVIVPYSIPIIFKIDNDNLVFSRNTNKTIIESTRDSVKNSISEIEARIEKDKASNITNSELNWYVFRSLRLGWINCDRFVRSRKPMTKLKVKIKNSEKSDVKLVFKNRYSILRGQKINGIYDFGNVPKGEEIVLIAIKSIKDKFYLAIKNSKTDVISNLNLDFEELTISEIKKKIDSMNLDF